MEKELILGEMEKIIMKNGKKAKNMAMEFGKVFMFITV